MVWHFALKTIAPVPEITKLSCGWLISFEVSYNAKGKNLDDMVVYVKDYDSTADYQILNSFETHLQSPGLNHSKCSIGNVRIRPIQK